MRARPVETREPPGRPLSRGHRLTAAAVFVVAPLLRLLFSTYRHRFAGLEHLDRVREDSAGAVVAFWHSQLVPCGLAVRRLHLRRGGTATAFASLSRDGELIARLGALWGYESVRGSTSRGGAAALRRLHRAVTRRGTWAMVAPDGPRGPAGKCQPGVVLLARRSGGPLLPLAAGATAAWRLRSWDRLMLPKPFSRVVVRAGDPLRLAPDAALEEAREELQRRLTHLQSQVTSDLATPE